MDDEELLDEDLDKRDDTDGAGSVVGSLQLWRQCLRPPCGVVDPDRERDDVRLRYGYDDDDDSAYVAMSTWPRRRRRGQCVTSMRDDDEGNDGPPTMVWPLAVRHCLPNGQNGKHLPSPLSGKQHGRQRHHDNSCGRLRVTLDPARLRRGTRVSAVCHSLRRLLARTWVRGDDEDLDPKEAENRQQEQRVYVMCEAAPAEDQRDEKDRGNNRRRRRRRVTVWVSVVRIQILARAHELVSPIIDYPLISTRLVGTSDQKYSFSKVNRL